MDQYTLNSAPYGTHALIASEIESDIKILDVGCNKGYLKTFIKHGTFYGFDYNPKDLELAAKEGYVYTEAVNLNQYESIKLKEKFDVIVMADVLEHLNHPTSVLNYFVENYLNTNGEIIISLPNIANVSIRLSLLMGKFDYTDAGILDRTHLHFYTLKSAREFIQKSNLTIVKEKFSSNRFGKLIEMAPFLNTLLGYNLIFVCKKR